MSNETMKENLYGAFQKQGARLTSQRRQILELLINERAHFTINELYRLAGKYRLKIGIATIYRTMPLLEKAGLVHSLHLPDGSVRYQAKLPGDRHHHLVCEQCGEVYDIGDDVVGNLEEQVFETSGFRVTHHNIQLVGLCGRCAARRIAVSECIH